VSDVHACAGLRVQCRVESGPSVQVLGPEAGSPARLSVSPLQDATSKTVVGPSGFELGAVAVLPPPPM
jgi:hypothetical protein